MSQSVYPPCMKIFIKMQLASSYTKLSPNDSKPEDQIFLHTIWLQENEDIIDDVPTRLRWFVKSWKRYHKDECFVHLLWTNDCAIKFFQEVFPQRLTFYLSLNTVVQKSDYLRLFLLYTFGGIYMDADMECKCNFLMPFF